ncbi:DsbA family protein [Epibacterium ulvae]|uniref:DsbA family protein n=1 Tax=Epibacterium ulvae TaxID=1156985 RepID=UPI0024902F49|nr:DsbA family protein [Epibacterium ulvae]
MSFSPFKSLSVAATVLSLTTAAQALDLNSMTEAERSAFGEEVRSYLLQNPEVILEAIDLLEQQQQVAEVQRDNQLVQENLAELVDDGYSWVGGNPDGDITLVEFTDYRCPYCRRAMPEVAKLLAQDGNIRFVIKEFPILGEASLISSRFAVAVKQLEGPEAYKEVHDALFELPGEPNDVTLGRLAEGFGLDAEAILARMNEEVVTDELRRTRALAQRMAISGTPSFVLGDELLRGFLPADQMQLMAIAQRDQRG